MDVRPEDEAPRDGQDAPDGAPPAMAATAAPPSLWLLFFTCFKVGCISFGGGLAGWFYRDFVLKHRWIGEDDFASSLAISQVMPGPNMVNLLIGLGDQLRGTGGALACVTGFLTGPFFIVIALVTGFDSLSGEPMLRVVSDGVAFAAMGLLLLMIVNGTQRVRHFPPSLGVIAVTAIAVGVLHWPLIPVVLVIAPISVAMAWRRV